MLYQMTRLDDLYQIYIVRLKGTLRQHPDNYKSLYPGTPVENKK